MTTGISISPISNSSRCTSSSLTKITIWSSTKTLPCALLSSYFTQKHPWRIWTCMSHSWSASESDVSAWISQLPKLCSWQAPKIHRRWLSRTSTRFFPGWNFYDSMRMWSAHFWRPTQRLYYDIVLINQNRLFPYQHNQPKEMEMLPCFEPVLQFLQFVGLLQLFTGV